MALYSKETVICDKGSFSRLWVYEEPNENKEGEILSILKGNKRRRRGPREQKEAAR